MVGVQWRPNEDTPTCLETLRNLRVERSPREGKRNGKGNLRSDWALLCWGRFGEAAEQSSICHELVPNPFYVVLRTWAFMKVDPDLDVAGALDEV